MIDDDLKEYIEDAAYRLRQWFALELYAGGSPPSFSTGICESLTAGYGKLDNYGYWEFPLPYPAEQYLRKNHG